MIVPILQMIWRRRHEEDRPWLDALRSFGTGCVRPCKDTISTRFRGDTIDDEEYRTSERPEGHLRRAIREDIQHRIDRKESRSRNGNKLRGVDVQRTHSRPGH